jgi:high frequency lysogenization protein
MMDDKLENTTIALAGMLQSVALVSELTQTGKTNSAAFEASIHSIFQFQAQNVPAVFGDLQGIKLGLETIIHSFDATIPNTNRLQSRYLLSLIYLQKRLFRSPKILDVLIKRLQQTQKQVDYFSLTHPTVIGNLADIYLHTVSTFKFRVVIMGSQRVLLVKENMEKVRALLLAGVRAAALWRQMGGSRFQILFSRAKIKAMAEKILAQLESHH